MNINADEVRKEWVTELLQGIIVVQSGV